MDSVTNFEHLLNNTRRKPKRPRCHFSNRGGDDGEAVSVF